MAEDSQRDVMTKALLEQPGSFSYVIADSHVAFKNGKNLCGISSIAMSPLFYENVVEHLCKENEKYKSWISTHTSGYYGNVDYYHCSIIETGFNEWIEKNI